MDMYGAPIITKNEKSILRVYRPILTEEEYERRMKRIQEAAARLIVAADLKKRKDT